MKKTHIILIFLFFYVTIQAQSWKWFDPRQSDIYCIQQRGWGDEMKNGYNRLPDRAMSDVRGPVWGLSRNSTGLSIHFYSNAPTVRIRYTVAGGYSMPHMPSTGVSGVDLYSIDRNGEWAYNGPNYRFGDTIEYTYDGLDTAIEKEYRLYLPLYNTVTWMEIGVPETAVFKIVPVRREKPIVVYGTSIAQGGCASRPGNAWTNILSRRLDWPVINLGFSGNGKLEPEVLKYINEIDAAVYILDCYPNLSANTVEENTRLTVEAVRQLRLQHRTVPIVIAEHAGYSHGKARKATKEIYEAAHLASKKAYEQLKGQDANLYYLTFDEIAQPMDGTVDGVHPNDYGMVIVANAHEKKLREIMNMPIGEKATMIPVTQRREPGTYGWGERHQDILKQNVVQAPERVIIGNSITHYWGGAHQRQNGKSSWESNMAPAGFRNLGCGWDYIQNVLWRVYHGELDGFRARQVILNIGTNNLHADTDDDIVEGLQFLLSAIRLRQPTARIKVVGIYPRRDMEKRIAGLNKKIKKRAVADGYEFCDVSKAFLLKNGKIDESLFLDGLHPNEKGYDRIVGEINKY